MRGYSAIAKISWPYRWSFALSQRSEALVGVACPPIDVSIRHLTSGGVLIPPDREPADGRLMEQGAAIRSTHTVAPVFRHPGVSSFDMQSLARGECAVPPSREPRLVVPPSREPRLASERVMSKSASTSRNCCTSNQLSRLQTPEFSVHWDGVPGSRMDPAR